jgi:hypothetical protein
MRFVAADDFRAALAGLPSIVQARAAPSTTVLVKQHDPARPRVATRWDWLMQRLRWLPGSIFVMGGGALVALMVLYTFVWIEPSLAGRFIPPILGSVLLGTGLMVLGLLLWALAELTRTPEGLRFSAKNGWASGVQTAARKGVPLDEPDEMGETALMHASSKGHAEVVKVLLLHGVDAGAVSSLGQTAIEIAYARGHGDIVALLQKERRPPRPPETTVGRRPSARRWLVGSALLGAALLVGYRWLYDPWPTPISYEEMRQLVLDKKVKTIEVQSGAILGEVHNPNEHPNLTRGRFLTQVPAGRNVNTDLVVRGSFPPGMKIIQSTTTTPQVPPPWWSIGVVLGIPAAQAWLIGWPLGSNQWFPMLRGERRG